VATIASTRVVEANQPGKRIVAVLHLAEVGGPARTLAPRLERLGRTASVETVLPNRGPLGNSLQKIGAVTTIPYDALVLPRGPRSALAAAGRFAQEVGRFWRHFRRSRPDLVIVSTVTLPAAVVAARLRRTPIVVDVGELWSSNGSRRGASGRRALLRLTARLADALVCCSPAVARQFPDEVKSKVEVIYPGISRSCSRGDGRRFRAAHGIPADAFCVLVVGNITPGRGQDVLVRAMPRILEELPRGHCIVVGAPHSRQSDLAYNEEVRAAASRLGVQEFVTFCGALDRMADAYAAADVVVNPATFVEEAFGRVAFEALVAGRPVVASRSGAIPDLLTDGHDALLVERGSPTGLADAVIRLGREPELRARLVAAGRDRTLRDFSCSQSVERFEQVARRLTA
jgi:glycosyltransferase involved in cell wall biosynthesis